MEVIRLASRLTGDNGRRRRRGLAVLLAVCLPAFAGAGRLFISGEDAGYLDPAACAACHQKIYESYRRTGMGRSFYRPRPENKVEDYSQNNSFFHEASDQHYTMYERGGRYYQRRRQIAPDGGETNVIEKEIHFVLGSGNHARSYLHLTPNGQLVQLPVAWYAGNGGFWGMNPGYDRPDHMDFRRRIDRECFFCHNAYPELARSTGPSVRELVLPGAIPEGIDCQRCHGPGQGHVQSVRTGASPETIRKAIVNPARLSRERQLEVCLQCHLESTSRRLPYAIRRYDRGYFSYRPGEPLESYILHFDHAAGAGYDDKFEIAHSAYRLLKSACFLKSNGALTCTTCHDPHEKPRADEARQRYVQACRSCHASAHNATEDCVGCHMPKRRTSDVVHVAMTDHYIQRRKADRDLLAPLKEVHDDDRTAYQGEVLLLYPTRLPQSPETELYLAAAQVTDGANLKGGIPRLHKAIEAFRPRQAEFYLELASAYVKSGKNETAVHYYEEALRRNPNLLSARREHALTLSKLGRLTAAVESLEAASGDALDDPATLNTLGSTYMELGKLDAALTSFRRALVVAPDLPEAHLNLGNALFRTGDRPAALDALMNAIRARPGFAPAYNNLANVLNAQGDFQQAQRHFRQAIRLDPEYAVARYNYGRALAENGMLEEAEAELRSALELDPRQAEAATSLGLVLVQKGRSDEAIAFYRQAIQAKPGLASAHFNLGLALLRQGDKTEARRHFEAAIRADPNDHQSHFHLGMILLNESAYELATTHLRKASETQWPDLRNAALEALQAARDKRQPSTQPR